MRSVKVAISPHNTDMEWGKVQHYHIALDSGTLGVDKCVDIIAGLY